MPRRISRYGSDICACAEILRRLLRMTFLNVSEYKIYKIKGVLF